MKTTIKQRFLDKIELIPEHTCWEWIGMRDEQGYGRIKIKGKRKLAHRVSYELHHKPLISSKIKVLHSCDNVSCVNPCHLFAGSQKDNVHDMMRKGRKWTPKGESNAGAILKEGQVQEIRYRVCQGETQLSLAKEYGVSFGAINNIIHRRTWKHI